MAPGDIIKGKYLVERVLGEGGMGVVLAARHLALGQRVAIKILRPSLYVAPEVVARFAREARAASTIESDHVARVTDVDTLDDGRPFMVMELLEGHDLSVVRDSGRGLPVPVAVGYVLEACEAIGEAHRREIVHRDIKPANLFLATKGDGRARIKVLDFGISKVGGAETASPRVTNAGVLLGSAEYMSPEQMMAARDVDARADIWALGVTLYELCTARLPFAGAGVPQVCALVLSSEPEPPSALVPGIPRGFDRVILRCLAKDRSKRYGSIAELARALAPYASASDDAGASLGSSPRLAAAEARTARALVVTADGTTRVVAALPRTSTVAIGMAAAVVLGLVAAGVAFVARSSPRRVTEGGAPSIDRTVAASSAPSAAPVSVSPAAELPDLKTADLPGAPPPPSAPSSKAGSSPRPPASAPPAARGHDGGDPHTPRPPGSSSPPRHTLD